MHYTTALTSNLQAPQERRPDEVPALPIRAAVKELGNLDPRHSARPGSVREMSTIL